jgi:hypothetical protein
VADGGGSLPVVFVARPGPRAVVREVRTESPPLPVSAESRPVIRVADTLPLPVSATSDPRMSLPVIFPLALSRLRSPSTLAASMRPVP